MILVSDMGLTAGAVMSVAETPAGEDDMDYDTSVANSHLYSGGLYTHEEINVFLDEKFGKSVKVSDYFPDVEKFELTLQENCWN